MSEVKGYSVSAIEKMEREIERLREALQEIQQLAYYDEFDKLTIRIYEIARQALKEQSK